MGVKGTRNKKKPKLNFSHRDLCFDLAEAKGTRFIEVPLGSVILNRGSGPGQADVITVKPSYNRFNVDIYEVKVTRSDFLQDVKKGKYMKYLPHCNRLYFAVKQGICKKEEIPEGVGLIVRGEKGWSTIKGAKKREVDFNTQMLQALIFFNGRVYNKSRVDRQNKLMRNINSTHIKNLKFLGVRIAEKIVNYNKIKSAFSNLLWDASKKITFASEKERDDFLDKWESEIRG